MSEEKEEEIGRLVVTRRLGESVIINNDINVMVIQIKGKQARLMITAPKSTPIFRQELYEKINNGKK